MSNFNETSLKTHENALIANNISELVKYPSPMMYLNRYCPNLNTRVVLKLDYMQPSLTMKDLVVNEMIHEKESTGELRPGVHTLVEATAGSTGVSIVCMAAAQGYKSLIVMPDSTPLEHIALLVYYGGDVELTPGILGMQGAIDRANKLVEEEENYVMLNQFENAGNPLAHYKYTGPQIWEVCGNTLAAFVAGSGTGGTISGVGKFLKEKNKNILNVVVEPAESPVISGGPPGIHFIHGLGPSFVPANLHLEYIDEVFQVTSHDAIIVAREVAKTEGLAVSTSAGAVIHAAISIAQRINDSKKVVVAYVAAHAERFMSTELFHSAVIKAQKLKAEAAEESLI
eukprot:TRINITY_DN12092_c0_g1_i1.p1 TRINITY_DN12092_c0_g1~~TRINITY_DN12092_c0_g1_i1.p1  ORF type:complete len:342 (+),score=92.23 TRINITY_DN12092_c0_g1_i1:267-1292(+)